MPYKVGQKVCLWQLAPLRHGQGRVVKVLKEVIVTITEIKDGVLGEFSQKPVSAQSLRGIGDDGKQYDKHWDVWPESQTRDYREQWSLRDDAGGEDPFWAPYEAAQLYGQFIRAGKRDGEPFKIVNEAGVEMKPNGDTTHCEKHDEYSLGDDTCFWCRLEAHDAERLKTA